MSGMASHNGFQILPLKRLVPLSFSARLEIQGEKLGELAETFKTHGVLEPLLVRPSADGKYEVVCGLRRLKAAEMAGLEAVPCIVKSLTDNEALESALIENIQRENLTDYEMGKHLKLMLEKFPDKYPNQESLANRIGKAQEYVSRHINHYEHIEEQKKTLPSNIMPRVIMLPEGVTRAVRQAPPEAQPKIMETVVKEDLSVRETKALVEALEVPSVSTEEAVEELRAEAREKAKAEKLKEEALIKKLGRCYPLSVVDEAIKRIGGASEEKIFKIIKDAIAIAWEKLISLQGPEVVDQIFEEAQKWG